MIPDAFQFALAWATEPLLPSALLKTICPPVVTSRKVTPIMSVHSANAVRASACSLAFSVLMLTVICPPCVTLKWWLSPPQ